MTEMKMNRICQNMCIQQLIPMSDMSDLFVLVIWRAHSTGIPCFSKLVLGCTFMHYERPTIVPVFTDLRKSDKDFPCMKKGEKQK